MLVRAPLRRKRHSGRFDTCTQLEQAAQKMQVTSPSKVQGRTPGSSRCHCSTPHTVVPTFGFAVMRPLAARLRTASR
jgi:hypothetical protein